MPQNNILGMPANITTQAIADGNWVFLKPLSPGNHKIVFKGGVTTTNKDSRSKPLIILVVPLHFHQDGILKQLII